MREEASNRLSLCGSIEKCTLQFCNLLLNPAGLNAMIQRLFTSSVPAPEKTKKKESFTLYLKTLSNQRTRSSVLSFFLALRENNNASEWDLSNRPLVILLTLDRLEWAKWCRQKLSFGQSSIAACAVGQIQRNPPSRVYKKSRRGI